MQEPWLMPALASPASVSALEGILKHRASVCFDFFFLFFDLFSKLFLAHDGFCLQKLSQMIKVALLRARKEKSRSPRFVCDDGSFVLFWKFQRKQKWSNYNKEAPCTRDLADNYQFILPIVFYLCPSPHLPFSGCRMEYF